MCGRTLKFGITRWTFLFRSQWAEDGASRLRFEVYLLVRPPQGAVEAAVVLDGLVSDTLGGLRPEGRVVEQEDAAAGLRVVEALVTGGA